MSNEEKKVSVSIDSYAKNAEFYKNFLVQPIKGGLRMDFADREDKHDAIKVLVKRTICIEADMMRSFFFDITRAMLNYEECYKDGKGLKAQEMPKEQVDEQ